MRFAGILAVLLLQACVLAGAKDKPLPETNPITGGAIATTTLDAPAAAQPAAAKPPAPNVAAAAGPADVKADAKVDLAPVAAVVLSPEAVKCAKSGGTWAGVGKSGAQACVTQTRDAGKSCRKQTQCEGLCLARSGTCAPITPLFGCNDIFQADGRRVTLCID
jgi:hypothetical protein